MMKPMVGLALCALAQTAIGDDKPYWELGLGVTGISFTDYIGSTERSNWVLPFPYVYYDSQRLRVDRESATGKLFEGGGLRLDFSLSGSLPVDSGGNAAREGMPELDSIIEAGPALRYELYQTRSDAGRLLLELPIRGAVATDLSHIDAVGWVSNPNLRYQNQRPRADGSWTVEATVGPVFGSQRYHDYFYTVEPRFATADRPAYEADAGFGGWRFSLGFSRRRGNIWYGGFIRYIDSSNAVFADSPLVKTDHSVLGGIAIAWILARSRDADDE